MPKRKNPQPSGDQRELRPRSSPNVAGSKRSRPREDPPPQRQVRPRSSAQAPNLPTPDDTLSIADSAAPSTSLPTEKKVPAGPANPGVVRKRDEGVFSRLPPDSDAKQEFGRLRRDGDLTDAEAFMKFLRTYDVSMAKLHQISIEKLPVSFSNVKYDDIAPYCWLDPNAQGRDIHDLDIFRSRLPMDVFRKIFEDVSKASLQYGRMENHDNEEARSRYIISIFSEIVCLFGSAIINKPEGLLEAEFTKKGRIKHHFYAMNSISIVFIEVKKTYAMGRGRLDVVAQILAESAACDYANSKHQHWVPILAILCDGEKFEFLVYDSGIKSIYTSGGVTGVSDVRKEPELLIPSSKKSAEYIFDYLLMAYINGLRSFGHRSEIAAAQTKSKKRESTDKWKDALARAERAHLLCREAAELARKGKIEEAEESATRGINELKESVLRAPNFTSQDISELWDENLAIRS